MATKPKTFESLSSKEEKMLEELLAKKKRIKKHDDEFFAEVDERRDEVSQFLGTEVSESSVSSKYDESRIDEILKSYDCTFDEFCDYVLGEKQLEAYLEKDGSSNLENSETNEIEKSDSEEKEENNLFTSSEPRKFWQ